MLRMASATIAVALLGAALALAEGPDTGLPVAVEIATLQNGFSIRYHHREAMGASTRLYLSAGKDSFVDVPTSQIALFDQEPLPEARPASQAAPAPSLQQVVDTASNRHQIDADLINSVIHAESGFNPRARSPKGAQGLMQLMPQTAAELGVGDPYNAQANVDGGTRYLRDLLELYKFDLVKALAAYNAGPGPVARYGGVPPYHETRAYVARVVREYNRKKLAGRATTSAAANSRGASASPRAARQ